MLRKSLTGRTYVEMGSRMVKTRRGIGGSIAAMFALMLDILYPMESALRLLLCDSISMLNAHTDPLAYRILGGDPAKLGGFLFRPIVTSSELDIAAIFIQQQLLHLLLYPRDVAL
jgi:hypothetical protein